MPAKSRRRYGRRQRNYYVSAGWIDSHVHCTQIADLPRRADAIGVAQGVTTVVDAGSTGADHIDDFIS